MSVIHSKSGTRTVDLFGSIEYWFATSIGKYPGFVENMTNQDQTPLVKGVQVALALGVSQAALAQPFDPELSWLELNESTGVVLLGRQDFDLAGYSVSHAGDFNGDGISDLVISANRAEVSGQLNVGLNYVVFGSNTGFPSGIELININGVNGVVFEGEEADYYTGNSVSAAGDFNGDGIDDILIGAMRASPNGNSNAGSSYVIFGDEDRLPNPLPLAGLNSTNGIRLDSSSPSIRSGFSVSGAGDINGDGIDDVIIGAPYSSYPSAGTGASYVLFGNETVPPSPFDLDSLFYSGGLIALGGSGGEASGFSVSGAGDLNGDGMDDLIIGAPGASPNGNTYAGRAYVLFGDNAGLPSIVDLGTINGLNGIVINGEAAGDYAGLSVRAAGDINGDGVDDVIIGAPYADIVGTASGRSYVVFGSDQPLPSPLNLSSLNGNNGFEVRGEFAGAQFGQSVSGAGDVNGDGLDDIIIGSPFEPTDTKYNVGRSYVVFGKADGFPNTLDVATLNGQNGFALEGVVSDEYSGFSVSGAGDFNGDGIDDLVATGPGFGELAGVGYVLFGRPSLNLALSKSNGSAGVSTGEPTTWTLEISNVGFADIFDAELTDTLPATVNAASASWSCTASAGATCPSSSGSGNINQTFNLPVGETLTYSLTATITADEPAIVTNTATVTLAGDLIDLNPANNTARDSDPVGLFSDGFENEG